jgi:inhibitor of KinA
MGAGKDIQVQRLGETAFILRNLGDVPSYALARALEGRSGILEAASSYDTVGLTVEESYSEDQLLKLLSRIRIPAPEPPRTHRIPVCYDLGPDLESSAKKLRISIKRLIAMHTMHPFRCYALGFSPGFPFLGYLPKALCGLPRLSSPRQAVPAGAVGMARNQTGIYPRSTPGGWNLIGVTPLTLVDLKDHYFPIAPGDLVHFHAIDEAEFAERKGGRL